MATINDLGMPNPITVIFGGTGVATNTTPYGVVCAGTTGTNPLQNIVSVGTAGQVLTSNGAGALPTFQNAGGGVVPNYTAPTAWTPALNFGGSTTGITYSSRSGTYMQIGQYVFFNCVFNLSSKGSQVGNATVTGLPVACLNLNTYPSEASGAVLSGIGGPIISILNTSTGSVVIELHQNNGTTNNPFLTNTNFANTSQIFVTGYYFST